MQLDDAAWVGSSARRDIAYPGAAEAVLFGARTTRWQRLDLLAPLAERADRGPQYPDRARLNHSSAMAMHRGPTAPAKGRAIHRSGQPTASSSGVAAAHAWLPAACASTTTHPACSPIAIAMLPVSTRVRLKIRPTSSHDRSESYTRLGVPKRRERARQQQIEAAVPAQFFGGNVDLGKQMQHREQGGGEQRRRPGARFALRSPCAWRRALGFLRSAPPRQPRSQAHRKNAQITGQRRRA